MRVTQSQGSICYSDGNTELSFKLLHQDYAVEIQPVKTDAVHTHIFNKVKNTSNSNYSLNLLMDFVN